MIRTKAGIACLCVLALQACGGSTGTPRDVLNESNSMGARLDALSPTAFRAMPTTGRASFNGFMFVGIGDIEAQNPEVLAVGDVSMTANFRSGSLTGSADNFVEIGPRRSQTPIGGQIDIGQNTSIIGDDFDDNLTNLPNDWRADFAGTINAASGTYDVQGVLKGQFLGTRVNNPTTDFPIRGLSGESLDGTFATLGGIELGASAGIIAEN